MTVAEELIDFLEASGVRYVFGNPGTTEVALLDALTRRSRFVKFVLALHESQAISMADGYTRISGRPGVAMVHATPGTANSIGNLYNAFHAHSPLVLLAGEQDGRLQNRTASLQSDLSQLVQQFTKARYRVANPSDAVRTLRRAMIEAQLSPRGPVFVSIPKDVLAVFMDEGDRRRRKTAVVPPAVTLPPAEVLGSAVRILRDARRPVAVVGSGVSEGGPEALDGMCELAELLGTPVYVEAYCGALGFPRDSMLFAGTLPVEAEAVRSRLVPADVIVAVGAEIFRERAFPPVGSVLPEEALLVQVDARAANFALDEAPDVAVLGDLGPTLRGLVRELRATATLEDQVSWNDRRLAVEQVARARGTAQRGDDDRMGESPEGLNGPGVDPERLFHLLSAELPPCLTVVDEAVRVSEYLANTLRLPRGARYLTHAGGLGWGLGAALGAALADSDHPVLACVGDGSFMYGVQALWTIQHLKPRLAVAVFENGGYAAVRRGVEGYRRIAARPDPVAGIVGVDIGGLSVSSIARGFGLDVVEVDALRDEPASGDLSHFLKMLVEPQGPVVFVIRTRRDAMAYHSAGYR